MLELYTVPLTRAEVESLRERAAAARGYEASGGKFGRFTLVGPEPPVPDAYEVNSMFELRLEGAALGESAAFVELEEALGALVNAASYRVYCGHGGPPPSTAGDSYGLSVSAFRSPLYGRGVGLSIFRSPTAKDLTARADLFNSAIDALGWSNALRAVLDADGKVVLRELDGSVTLYETSPLRDTILAERFALTNASESKGRNPSHLLFVGFQNMTEVVERSNAVLRAVDAEVGYARVSIAIELEHYDEARSIAAVSPFGPWELGFSGGPRYDASDLARLEAELDSFYTELFRLNRRDTGEVSVEVSYDTEEHPSDRPYVLCFNVFDFEREDAVIALLKEWAGGRDVIDYTPL